MSKNVNIHYSIKDKVATEDFEKYIIQLVRKFKNKKVVLYGAGAFFEILLERGFLKDFNVVGISDIKFGENSYDSDMFKSFQAIPPSELNNTDFDVLLLCTVSSYFVLSYLKSINLKRKKIEHILKETFSDRMHEVTIEFDYY